MTEIAERICPECESTLAADATYCGCGWGGKRGKGAKVGPGPDYARIKADMESSKARLWATHTGTRACQSTLCPTATRAQPGKELCAACEALEASGTKVPRIRRPSWATNAGDTAERLAA